MDILELCNAVVASVDRTLGSKPLRTFVDDHGNFTIEEETGDDTIERCTGYVDPNGRREPPDMTRWRRMVLGSMVGESL